LIVAQWQSARTQFWDSYQGVDSVQIKISARHGHLSEPTQSKITSKLERLPRFFDRLTTIDLTVDLEHRDTPTVDLRVSAEHKHDFRASSRSDNLMASVDAVLDKMEQQLRKYKQKVQERHRSPSSRQAQAARAPEPEGP
jgi:putative sigma-54 modulation protein